MPAPERIPGWGSCPTCGGDVWHQWRENELLVMAAGQAEREGGNLATARDMGLGEVTLRRIRKGRRVTEEILTRMQLYFTKKHHISPMSLAGLGRGGPIRTVFGRFNKP